MDYSILIKQLPKEFEEYLVVQGLTTAYCHRIPDFIKFCELNGIDVFNPSYININNYILLLKKRNYANNTINLTIFSLKSFYKFLVLSKGLSHEVLDTICKFKRLKLQLKKKIVFTTEELAAMISYTITIMNKSNPYKIQAVGYLLFYTGIRKGEIVNTTRTDFNFEKQTLHVRAPTKNKMERYVYFPPQVGTMIKAYFESENEKKNAFNLTEDKIDYMVKIMSTGLPPEKRISSHNFRHSFATMMCEDTNLKIVQKLMGHKNIQSTLIYFDPDEKMVERVYKKNINDKQFIKPDVHFRKMRKRRPPFDITKEAEEESEKDTENKEKEDKNAL